MKHFIYKHIKLHSKFQICLNKQSGSSPKRVISLYYASELGEVQKDILSPMKQSLSNSHNHKIRSSLQILEPLHHFQLCLYNCSPHLHRKGYSCYPQKSGNSTSSLAYNTGKAAEDKLTERLMQRWSVHGEIYIKSTSKILLFARVR